MYNYSIFDAHCDTLCMIADHGADARINAYNTAVSDMLSYRAYTQVYACFIDPKYKPTAMERFNLLADCFDAQNFEGITPILSVEDGSMIESLEDVEYLHSRGVRCIALTWNGSNKIGGGAEDPNTGLTEFGKSVIRKMNELNMLVDVSHLNDKTFYDAARVNGGPLIATHSNSRTVCPHRRNLTDDMYKIIIETGGAAGINFYPLFLTESKKCDISDIIRHIDHFLELGGENSLGIGADFDGTDNELPVEITGTRDMYKVFDALRSHGIDDGLIEKISHANFERVFKKEIEPCQNFLRHERI